MASALQRYAESASALPLLRIYWYDGTNQGPTAPQIAIAQLDNVKVRLGFVNSWGQQKGVDSLIVADMIALARNGAMAECVLLTGDEDLRVGVQQAQEFGIRVHLLGVKPLRGSQSVLLYQEADTTHEWDSSDLSEFMEVTRADHRDSKPHSRSSRPVHEPRAVSDRLQAVAESEAERIPEAELRSLAGSIARKGVRPREIDSHLLVMGRQALGRNLEEPEKRLLRDEFGKALASRSR